MLRSALCSIADILPQVAHDLLLTGVRLLPQMLLPLIQERLQTARLAFQHLLTLPDLCRTLLFSRSEYLLLRSERLHDRVRHDVQTPRRILCEGRAHIRPLFLQHGAD